MENRARSVLAAAIACVCTVVSESKAAAARIDPPQGSSSSTQVASPSAGTPDPLHSISNTSEFVNEFTGQAAFNIALGTISNHGAISYAPNLVYYGGGLEHNSSRKLELNPTSWVGEGFALKAPYILADAKGTVATEDDSYVLSLDGVTQLDLIPESGNLNSLYPKIRPYQHVSRSTGGSYAPWVVEMPDGTKYQFESSTDINSCDAAKNALCMPTKGPLFYPAPQATKVPVLWYLSSIESRDGAFRIFFDYHKVIVGSMDRATYLERIYAVNGITKGSQVISEMIFQREAKPDYYDNSFRDPLAQFEAERLANVILKNQGQTVREFRLNYQSGSDKSRLIGITEKIGLHERNYYRCEYDAVNPWQIKRVFGPSGVFWEYGYAPTAVNGAPQSSSIDLGALPTNDTLQIAFSGEFHGKYYVLLSAFQRYDGGSFPRILYEFEHRGTYWKRIRTFRMPVGNETQFAMAPDGSYFSLAYLPTAISRYSLRIFDPQAPSLEGVAEVALDGPSAGFPSQFMVSEQSNLFLKKTSPLNPSLPVPVVGPQIYAFNDWLAMYRPGYGTVLFFQKNGSSWTSSCPDYGTSAKPDAYVLNGVEATAGLGFKMDPPTSTNPCLSWDVITSMPGGVTVADARLLEVRPGDNFIAVILKNVGGSLSYPQQWTTGGAIRVFAKVSGQILWIDPLNTIPHVDVTLTNSPAVMTWGTTGARAGTRNDLLLDVSVQGDLIGILSRWIVPAAGLTIQNKYLQVLSVNLEEKQMNPIYTTYFGPAQEQEYPSGQPKYSANDAQLFMGRNMLVYKRRKPGMWPPDNNFNLDVYHFNRTTGQTEKLPGYDFSARFNTAVKIMGDYFFTETVKRSTANDSDQEIYQAYHQVVSGENYPVTGAGILARIVPSNGSAPSGFQIIPVPGLNQITLDGDRYLAYDNSVGKRIYVYGRINETGPPTRVEIAASPNTMVGVLSPNGVLEFNKLASAPQIRFYDDFKGNLSPTSVHAVSQVKISTKGSASTTSDGTEQTIQFDYSSGSPQYNAKGKVHNFNKVKRILAGPSSQTITEYAADFEGAELAGALQNLHGMPVKITVRPGSVSGRQPGEVETQIDYTVAELGTAPSAENIGAVLRQNLQATRTIKSTSSAFFFGGVRKTESRYADFDGRNGLPRVEISRRGGDYRMDVTVFDDAAASSVFLVKQKASYLFTDLTSDPCTGSSAAPCSNINIPWFLAAESREKKAIASQAFTYTSQGDVNQSFTWRPVQLGVTGLQTLDGSVTIPSGQTEQTAGKWVKESEVLSRAKDVSVALSKHGDAATTDNRGIKATTFYGGLEGLPLAVAENASKTVCTFLGAEEETIGTGFGAYGDWEPIGSISADMSHSGQRSIKSSGAYGPSLNIHFKQDAEFWARGKGVLVSGWIFVPGVKSGNPLEDPIPAAAIELRTSAAVPPAVFINLIPQNFLYNRWIKLERLVTWTELNAIGGTDPVIRVWFGKAQTPPPSLQNTLPVYVDDLRIIPSDATMISRNYDARGRVTSILDAANLPTFPQYNVWDEPIGSKNDRGRLFSASAIKRAGEE